MGASNLIDASDIEVMASDESACPIGNEVLETESGPQIVMCFDVHMF